MAIWRIVSGVQSADIAVWAILTATVLRSECGGSLSLTKIEPARQWRSKRRKSALEIRTARASTRRRRSHARAFIGQTASRQPAARGPRRQHQVAHTHTQRTRTRARWPAPKVSRASLVWNQLHFGSFCQPHAPRITFMSFIIPLDRSKAQKELPRYIQFRWISTAWPQASQLGWVSSRKACRQLVRVPKIFVVLQIEGERAGAHVCVLWKIATLHKYFPFGPAVFVQKGDEISTLGVQSGFQSLSNAPTGFLKSNQYFASTTG